MKTSRKEIRNKKLASDLFHKVDNAILAKADINLPLE